MQVLFAVHLGFFRFRLAPPQRVFALERSHRLDGVRAADGLRASFGHPKVLHLALQNQILHRARHIFNRHVRVNAMLIEQINDIHFEPLERAFDGLFDVRRLAVQARRTRPVIAAAQIEAEFRGDDYLLAKWREGFAHEFLVGERAINLGCVEERDARFDCRPDQ